MAGIGRGESAGEQESCLLARSPRACAIQLPLLSELRHGHLDAEPFERPHRDHLVVPIVVHGDALEAIRDAFYRSGGRCPMLERKSHQRPGDLAVPRGANPVFVLGSAHRQRGRPGGNVWFRDGSGRPLCAR